jgi:hypothetical protein
VPLFLQEKWPALQSPDYTYCENALISLAHLGLARAYALEGSQTGSRAEYKKFFALWKDADPDVPVLPQARRDYDHLAR